jgi:hypothetical protein
MSHAPQLPFVVVLMHVPWHRVWVPVHWHEPALHVLPPVHTFPHSPQLAELFLVFTHAVVPSAPGHALNVPLH